MPSAYDKCAARRGRACTTGVSEASAGRRRRRWAGWAGCHTAARRRSLSGEGPARRPLSASMTRDDGAAHARGIVDYGRLR